ncbi:MAG: hypothetical protein ACRYG5_08720 [Janthinobacterium lividum]
MSERSARNAGVKSAAGAFSFPFVCESLCPSIGAMLVLALFSAASGMAVWLTLISWIDDTGLARALALSTVGMLGLLARRYLRQQPVAIEIGRDGLVLWQRGAPHGQWFEPRAALLWPGCLLGLRLLDCDGRSHVLLLPADALSAAGFHRLALMAVGRRAGGARRT